MITNFNVGDTVLLKSIVEAIYVETTDNEPIYHVRIKGAGEHEAYSIRVKEDIMWRNGGEHKRPTVEITEKQAIDKLYETGWMQEHDRTLTSIKVTEADNE